MPIESEVGLSHVGQEEFHALDKVLMKHAFEMHNTMGRFFDEQIYQTELANRCADCGFEAAREVEIRARHRTFTKSYYLDLLVGRGIIYELKTAESLGTAHQKQLIHYLLLTGLGHGKLVNFRPGSVESRFVSTKLAPDDRKPRQINDDFWRGDDEKSRILKNTFLGLLDDWGTFLDASLYREALLHFLHDVGGGVRPVEIILNGKTVGSQKMCLLDFHQAWHLSAVRMHLESYETHIRRMLYHTRLKSVHWINLNHHQVTLRTLEK